jgi:Plasmid stabilization system protein
LKIYRVKYIAEAEQDLREIIHFIARHDSLEHALYVLGHIEQACERLKRFPERGRIPFELRELGLGQYREVFFKPYRIIYQITGKEVYIHGMLDGRRDLQILLHQRLMR